MKNFLFCGERKIPSKSIFPHFLFNKIDTNLAEMISNADVTQELLFETHFAHSDFSL